MGSTGSNKAALLGGTALALLAFGQAVMAQQAQPARPQVNEAEKQDRVILLERLVLGAGAEKVAIDTPQAVTVVDQEDIDREQPETIGDIFDGVPGMAKIGSDRVLGESFNIRGIGTAEATGDESKIIVNIDGVKKFYEQYRMGSFFSDPELYKQVEVLRGPASSTLYGSGALGGVINFQTKDASDFIAEGKRGAVRMKSSYYSNGDGYLVSPLIAHRFNDNVEVLATGNYRSSDIMEQADGRDLVGSEFDTLSGLLKGTVRFGESNEQVLRASYQQWNSEGDDQRYNQTGSAGVGPTDFGTVDRDVKDRTAILAYENPFSDNDMLNLKIQASYSDTSVVQTDASGKPARGDCAAPPLGSIIFCDTAYGYETWQLNAENTSTWSGEGWQNFLTYGFQASTQTREGHRLDTGGPISTHPEGDDTRLGLFTQNEFVWNEKLTIIPGIRGEFIWQEGSDDIQGARAVEDFAASPKIAALYKFNDTFSVFGSIAHTERFPTLDELYTYSDEVPPGRRGPGNAGKTLSLDLEKETSNNFETGFTLAGNDLVVAGDGAALKTTAFYNKISNLIISNSNLPYGTLKKDWPTYFSNVDKATIYGIEIEGSYETDRFFSRLGYTALKGTNDTDNEDLNSIPAHKLSLTLGGRHPDYWLEYGAKINFVGSAGAGVVSADETNRPLDPGERRKTSEGSASYQTVDLFASWKPKEGKFAGLEATFGVDNLFDEDYRDNQTPDRSTGRSFKFTLAKQFDYQ